MSPTLSVKVLRSISVLSTPLSSCPSPSPYGQPIRSLSTPFSFCMPVFPTPVSPGILHVFPAYTSLFFSISTSILYPTVLHTIPVLSTPLSSCPLPSFQGKTFPVYSPLLLPTPFISRQNLPCLLPSYQSKTFPLYSPILLHVYCLLPSLHSPSFYMSTSLSLKLLLSFFPTPLFIYLFTYIPACSSSLVLCLYSLSFLCFLLLPSLS
jgi:hypothetical protein